MNPGKHTQSHLAFVQDVWAGDTRAAQRHRDFYDEYNAVADLHGAYYLQTVRSVFQEFDLPGEQLALRTTGPVPALSRKPPCGTVRDSYTEAVKVIPH